MGKNKMASQKHPSHPQRDPVRLEIQKMEERMRASKKKHRKLKIRCADLKDQVRDLQRTLEEERRNSARRELHTKIQTRLEDLAFYRGERNQEGL